jgi:predicted CoA-binding protein
MNNMPQDIKDILAKYKTVAVIGLSRDPQKYSHIVAKYLQEHDYNIIPVNPTANEILERKSYKELLSIPRELQRKIEIVDIFRPSEDVPPIVEQAIKLKERYDTPQVIWMQLDIINEQAATKAKAAGIIVIMNKCMMREHKKLFPATEPT